MNSVASLVIGDTNKNNVDALNRIIAICYDGIRFCEYARETVSDPRVKACFARKAETRKIVMNRLQRQVTARGYHCEPTTTFAGNLRMWVAGLMEKWSSDPEATLINQLEKVEQRTIDAARSEIQDMTDLNLRAHVARTLNYFTLSQDELREIKETQFH